jgi:hypothetical protein
VSFILDDPRVLVCGWRNWQWTQTVHTILDRLYTRYGDQLVVIEGAATGADNDAHMWCLSRGWEPGSLQHRCYPVDWGAARRTRADWRAAGPERNHRMLVEEKPKLIIACHPGLDPKKGGTNDMCLRGLLTGVPVWLVSSQDPSRGRWLSLEGFHPDRIKYIKRPR